MGPTSFKVFLQLIDKDETKTFEMKRDKGVYSLKVDGRWSLLSIPAKINGK